MVYLNEWGELEVDVFVMEICLRIFRISFIAKANTRRYIEIIGRDLFAC